AARELPRLTALDLRRADGRVVRAILVAIAFCPAGVPDVLPVHRRQSEAAIERGGTVVRDEPELSAVQDWVGRGAVAEELVAEHEDVGRLHLHFATGHAARANFQQLGGEREVARAAAERIAAVDGRRILIAAEERQTRDALAAAIAGRDA